MASGDGTIITDGNGNYLIAKGGQWLPYNGPNATKRGGGSPKMSQTDEKFLNTLSDQARSANETGILYDRARQDIKTLKPGPNRGRFMQMATADQGGGIADTLGSWLIGGPARLIGAITPEETEAYQHLKGLQAGNVLTRQLEQKGPQTESDAARLALTEISPDKTTATNMDVIEQGKRKVARTRAYTIFAQNFAAKYGLHGTSPHGYTLDQLWQHEGDRITDSLFPDTAAAKNVRGGHRVTSVTRIK